MPTTPSRGPSFVGCISAVSVTVVAVAFASTAALGVAAADTASDCAAKSSDYKAFKQCMANTSVQSRNNTLVSDCENELLDANMSVVPESCHQLKRLFPQGADSLEKKYGMMF